MSDLFGVKMSVGSINRLRRQASEAIAIPVAQALLGLEFGGILNSDRYSAYNWLDVSQRQLCWAHLSRVSGDALRQQGRAASAGTKSSLV